MTLQDGLAVRVNLAVENGRHPGSLEAEVEPTDAGEEGRDAHVVVVQTKSPGYCITHTNPREPGVNVSGEGLRMVKARSSKALLKQPAVAQNISDEARQRWLDKQKAGFASPSASNREYYGVILEALWPQGHGIPGPHLTEADIRSAVDAYRASKGLGPYKDVFRRVRELQGEEGFTSIDKEGVRYQLTSLEVSQKKEPRQKPPPALWKKIKQDWNFRCSHCGAQEPDVNLSPDHRVPRSRGGTNEEWNWQPLCQQCNTQKSSACQGCTYQCPVCSWAYPETYKPIVVDDDNKERIRRAAELEGAHQSELVNRILRDHFNRKR